MTEHKNIKITDTIVDIDAMIEKSGSKFFKSLPKFVINRIKKIIHQDEMNRIHRENKHKIGMDYVYGLLAEGDIKIDIKGEEGIDKNKKYVYVANHPLGGIDALSFLHCVYKNHNNVVSPSNEMFENIPNLHPLIVGINVFGQNTKEKIKAVNEAFASDKQIMIFPAGEVSRRIKGKIIDPKWQKTFISKAIQSKRDIVPAHISGRNTNKFYRIANLRKFFGIKMYIESLYLIDEMLKQYYLNLKITLGKPIPYTSLTKEFSHQEWAQKVKDLVYSLPL